MITNLLNLGIAAASHKEFPTVSNKSCYFNGVDSRFVNDGWVNGFDVGWSPFTLMAWIKTSVDDTEQVIFSEWGEVGPGQPRFFKLSTDATGLLDLKNSGVGQYVGSDRIWYKSSIKVADGQWHHVAAVKPQVRNAPTNDPADPIQLYIDGVIDPNINEIYPNFERAFQETGLRDLVIGTDFDGNLPFTGLIQDVRYYRAIYTAQEVQTEYEGLTPPNRRGIELDGSPFNFHCGGIWSMQENSADTVYDVGEFRNIATGENITIVTDGPPNRNRNNSLGYTLAPNNVRIPRWEFEPTKDVLGGDLEFASPSFTTVDNKSCYFNGVDSRFLISNPDIGQTFQHVHGQPTTYPGPYTLMAWIKTDVSDKFQNFFVHWSTGGTGQARMFKFATDESGLLHFQAAGLGFYTFFGGINGSDDRILYKSSVVVADGEWHHVCVIRPQNIDSEGSTTPPEFGIPPVQLPTDPCIMVIDGVVDAGIVEIYPNFDRGWAEAVFWGEQIGADYDGLDPFEGLIQDVRFYWGPSTPDWSEVSVQEAITEYHGKTAPTLNGIFTIDDIVPGFEFRHGAIFPLQGNTTTTEYDVSGNRYIATGENITIVDDGPPGRNRNNQLGYTAVGDVRIPRNEIEPTKDVLGGDLGFVP